MADVSPQPGRWHRGTKTIVRPGTVNQRSDADEAPTIAESRELVRASEWPESALAVAGNVHGSADIESLGAIVGGAPGPVDQGLGGEMESIDSRRGPA